MGGSGSSSGKGGSGGGANANLTTKVQTRKDYIGNAAVEKQITDYAAHNLGSGESYAQSTGEWEVVKAPKNSDYMTVRAEIETSVRVPDGEGGYDYEYSYTKENIRVRWRS